MLPGDDADRAAGGQRDNDNGDDDDEASKLQHAATMTHDGATHQHDATEGTQRVNL